MNILNCNQLREWSAEGKNFKLIDIRELYEAELETLGGECIPMEHLESHMSKIPTDIPVVIHCNSGKRSKAAVYHLSVKHGFSNLFTLEGGIAECPECRSC
ncbi:MAG: rhodanese-like domain-containing protein [Flavobacteriales bacterium]|jgi:adenylyltransferase/sulfurtransferase